MIAGKNTFIVTVCILFCLSNNNIHPRAFLKKSTIRVCIKNSNPDYERYWTQLKNIWPTIEKFGLTLINENDSCDVILCSEITDDILNQSKPIIACDPIDCCVVMPEILEHIAHPNIKAVFKNFGAQPRSINNLPRVYWAYHFKILNDLEPIAEICPPQRLSRACLRKIRTVPWAPEMSLINKDLQTLKNSPVDLAKPRSIDVFFAGRIEYNLPGSEVKQVFTHRRKAVEFIKNMKDINSLLIINKFISFTEYIEKMKDAKIAVSPWGYGEWCWRDFEGMLSGAVVIKPYCHYIDYPKKIYQANKTYVPCKPDFSDLEEKIQKILNNWGHFYKMRKYARNLLLQTTVADFAKHFALQVREVLNK